jgi:hypothetical protein
MEHLEEQRRHRRHPVQFNCSFSPTETQIEVGTVLDLSLGGARIMSHVRIPPETAMELHIRPGRDTFVKVSRAVVRWVNRGVFGVEFRDVMELEAATLTRLLWSLPPDSRK